MVLFYIIWYSTSMFFGLMMLLVVCLMMDVTSCGSMAGSACAAFRAVGPCIPRGLSGPTRQCGQRPRRDGHRTLKI